MKWVAFPLHPETPEEGLTLEALFAGRDIDIPAALDRLRGWQRTAAWPSEHGLKPTTAGELRSWENGLNL